MSIIGMISSLADGQKLTSGRQGHIQLCNTIFTNALVKFVESLRVFALCSVIVIWFSKLGFTSEPDVIVPFSAVISLVCPSDDVMRTWMPARESPSRFATRTTPSANSTSLPAWTSSIAGRVAAVGEFLEQPANTIVNDARTISDMYFFILIFKQPIKTQVRRRHFINPAFPVVIANMTAVARLLRE